MEQPAGVQCEHAGSSRVKLTCLLLLLVCAFAFIHGHHCLADDQEDVLEAVRRYFEAEKEGNIVAVWNLLAASSEFKKAFSYPFYEEMVRRHPVVLKDYRIEGIPDIQENQDRKTMPDVDKIATVKVTVSLVGEGDKELTQLRVFTFLKESGRWFKG
ncbi:MAG: hypothetical protein QG577_254 [Thermodesulfobacteriota bacterium]|nr:hypothetical protein [Thermodesulfobacteriota bacterium]